jgi:DNA-binding PadR family transcriptional regulator
MVFGHGDLRLYLLKLLDEEPRYGYELIRMLEDRFLGAYTPSAGTIYPRLGALEEEGLVEHTEEEGRKVYRLTDAGRAELAGRENDMVDLEERVGNWASDLAQGVLGDLKESLDGLSRELRGTLLDTGLGQADVVREAVRFARDASRAGRHAGRDARREGRDRDRDARRGGRDRQRGRVDVPGPLRADLHAFVTDVAEAAAARPPDRDRLRRVQQLLLDTRHAIGTILDEGAPVAEEVDDADVEIVADATDD